MLFKCKIKRQYATIMILSFSMFVCGCSLKTGLEDEQNTFSVAIATDVGGINDQSFNMSSWNGLVAFSQRTGAKIRYLESSQSSDYFVNIDRLSDEKLNLIWGIGFSLADTVKRAAIINPECNYAIIDYAYGDDILDNVTCVVFRAQEASFIVGYIAGKTTKNNLVGFVGGIAGNIISQFEYGYRAGVEYAAKEMKKNIDIKVQYAESFSDSAKGKAIGLKMFADGCDIVFHAAGGAGIGLIEAAKETNNFAIGVDRDQSYLAPNNVLTSAIKDTGKAVDIVTTMAMNKEKIGGKILSYGIKEDCVGIPKQHPNIPDDVYKEAMLLEDKISLGKISPPYNNETYSEFKKLLLDK